MKKWIRLAIPSQLRDPVPTGGALVGALIAVLLVGLIGLRAEDTRSGADDTARSLRELTVTANKLDRKLTKTQERNKATRRQLIQQNERIRGGLAELIDVLRAQGLVVPDDSSQERPNPNQSAGVVAPDGTPVAPSSPSGSPPPEGEPPGGSGGGGGGGDKPPDDSPPSGGGGGPPPTGSAQPPLLDLGTVGKCVEVLGKRVCT